MFEAHRRHWEKNKYRIAAAGGTLLFLIGLWQFSAAARKEVQLQLCVEASGTSATLAEDKAANVDLKNNPRAAEFKDLSSGKRGVIEDRCVVGAIEIFKSRVLLDDPTIPETPERLALTVAFACRRMLTKGWNIGEIDIYHLQKPPVNFTEVDEFKSTMQQIPDCKD